MPAKQLREHKDQLTTWNELKDKIRKLFVARTYKQDLYVKLNSLQQNHLTLEQYIQELERLYMACDCKDEKEQKMAKFLFGLFTLIVNHVELHQYSFDKICSLTSKVERQQKEAKGKNVRYSSKKVETPKQEPSKVYEKVIVEEVSNLYNSYFRATSHEGKNMF